MLPQLLSFFGPQIATALGVSATPLVSSAVGAGVGSLLQGGNIGQGLMTGMNAYATGGIYGALGDKAMPGGAMGMTGKELGQRLGAAAGSYAGMPRGPAPGQVPLSSGPGSSYSQRLATPSRQRLRGQVKQFQEGGIMSMITPEAKMNDKEIVSAAIKALKGQMDQENAVRVLADFSARFGREALLDLMDRLKSGAIDAMAQQSEGMIRGAGDGMDDLVPATLEGEEDVLLSDNEYIVPADVVSGLGNGSSEAGARKLDRMNDEVRRARTGTHLQPKQINSEAMIPA
jgi:hypothetical protein